MSILDNLKAKFGSKNQVGAVQQKSGKANDVQQYLEPRFSTQEDVIKYIKNVPDGITFIHGKAGSGKTHIIRQLQCMVLGCKVLTPTNLASSLYFNGSTLHSFFYGGFDNLEEGFQNPLNISYRLLDQKLASRIRGVSLLVIDEISMVRADTLEMANAVLQNVMKNNKPFGGIPVVLVGDLFQLPPIVESEATRAYLQQEYGGIYFFIVTSFGII